MMEKMYEILYKVTIAGMSQIGRRGIGSIPVRTGSRLVHVSHSFLRLLEIDVLTQHRHSKREHVEIPQGISMLSQSLFAYSNRSSKVY